MQILLTYEHDYVLRFDLDEDVVAGMKKFAETEGITAASFTGIGAAKRVVLSYYEIKDKVYLDKTITDDVEIVGMIGNIATKDGATAIHIHGTFSDPTCVVWGGHVKEAIVSATCEIMLRRYPGTLVRQFDERTGLNLLHQPSGQN